MPISSTLFISSPSTGFGGVRFHLAVFPSSLFLQSMTVARPSFCYFAMSAKFQLFFVHLFCWRGRSVPGSDLRRTFCVLDSETSPYTVQGEVDIATCSPRDFILFQAHYGTSFPQCLVPCRAPPVHGPIFKLEVWVPFPSFPLFPPFPLL